jgi:hypothetical protein
MVTAIVGVGRLWKMESEECLLLKPDRNWQEGRRDFIDEWPPLCATLRMSANGAKFHM